MDLVVRFCQLLIQGHAHGSQSCQVFFTLTSCCGCSARFLSAFLYWLLVSIHTVCFICVFDQLWCVIPTSAKGLPSSEMSWLALYICKDDNYTSEATGGSSSRRLPLLRQVCCDSAAPVAHWQLMDTQAFTCQNPRWALHSQAARSGVKMFL